MTHFHDELQLSVDASLATAELPGGGISLGFNSSHSEIEGAVVRHHLLANVHSSARIADSAFVNQLGLILVHDVVLGVGENIRSVDNIGGASII